MILKEGDYLVFDYNADQNNNSFVSLRYYKIAGINEEPFQC